MDEPDTRPESWLKRFSGWPIIGRLWEVPPEALKEARAEVVSATFYSTMPFWFLPVIGSVIFLNRPSLWSGVNGGELLVYAAALVGPLAYIITKRHGRFKVPDDIEEGNSESELSYPFPYGRASFYLASLLCIMSGLVFTIQRLKSLEQFKGIPLINEAGLVWLSLVIAVFSTILLFCVTAYRNMLESLERKHSDRISLALRGDEDRTYDQWLDRKGIDANPS